MRKSMILLGLGLTLASIGPAVANPPAEADRPGRFIMQPIEGGVMRMDTETGAMSFCTRQSGTLACAPVPEQQIEVRRPDDPTLPPVTGQAPGGDRPGRRSPRFEIPSEEDVDKALNYVDRMLRKFRERLRDFEGGGRGTPL